MQAIMQFVMMWSCLFFAVLFWGVLSELCPLYEKKIHYKNK